MRQLLALVKSQKCSLTIVLFGHKFRMNGHVELFRLVQESAAQENALAVAGSNTDFKSANARKSHKVNANVPVSVNAIQFNLPQIAIVTIVQRGQPLVRAVHIQQTASLSKFIDVRYLGGRVGERTANAVR